MHIRSSSREDGGSGGVTMLVLANLAAEEFYSPEQRLLNKTELRSVLKSLAKFHADGIKEQ